MTATQDKNVLSRRVVISTVLLASILLVGVVLFLVFVRQGRSLLDLGLNLTTTTTT